MSSPSAGSVKRSFALRLLTSNDVYRPQKFSCLKTMIPRYQGKGVTKCVFPGDFLGGSLFSVSHQGLSMIEVCNEVGFDYVTLGNHEFDYGSSRLEELMSMSTFKWLGSNIRYADEERKLFHTVHDYDTFLLPALATDLGHEDSDKMIKVGVFGLCTQHTPELSSPSDAIVFEDVLSHSKRLVMHMKKVEKCDIIIALTHISLPEDKLVAEINGIDLILGGHEHEPYVLEHRNVLIMKCGQNLDNLGIIDLHIDCNFKRDHSSSGDYVKSIEIHRSLQLISTHDVDSDPKIDAIIRKWKNTPSIGSEVNGEEDMDEALTIVDLISGIPLSTRTSECRGRETAFCCILADAYKFICEEEGLHCDFAIQNGGFVRGDASYPPGATITRAIIAEELPFVQTPILIEMKGKDVLEALAGMLPKTSNAGPLGSFPHLSNGITACYDLDYEAHGRPSKVFDVFVNDEELDPGRVYRVATTSFYVFEAADGVTAFNHKLIIKNFEYVCKEAMMRYLRTLDCISNVPPNRLVHKID
jgi:5'-nucleotidase / UDP-sugar diphosphatase